jgi:hypothetical protein
MVISWYGYIGMDITFIGDKADLSMNDYVDQLLRQYDVTTGVNAPSSNDIFAIRSNTSLNDDLRQYFHSSVAKLLYLGKRMYAR